MRPENFLYDMSLVGIGLGLGVLALTVYERFKRRPPRRRYR